ncbi:uncharacterized protein LOC144109685 [Amblyomma americanum]
MASDESVVSPVCSTPTVRCFPKQAKQVALNVLEALRVECGGSWSTNALIKRTAKLTQVSERTLYKWTTETLNAGRVLSPKKRAGGRGRERTKKLDDFDLSVLRRVVHTFFQRGEIPTIAKVVAHFEEDETLPTVSAATMQRMLKKLGFRYKKRSRNAMLIEATHIVQCRRRYLRQIAELRRQGRPIFFTDETWVNAGHTRSRVWTDCTIQSAHHANRSGLSTGLQNPSGKGGRLIVTHCGSEQGFVEGAAEVFRAKKNSGDYHEEMNGEHYENWFSRRLLPLLPPGSVIVMDNAPYHSVKQDKVPRMSSLKKDIQAWLSGKGVSWSSGMVKAELMQLVSNVNTGGEQYRVDCIAKAAGHLVVRLPPYHCQLNPIELVWSDVKGFVASQNKTFKLQDVEPLVWQGLTQVTVEKWKNYVQHIISEEDVLRKLDHIIDDVVDQGPAIVVNLEDDTTSSAEFSCYEDDEMIEPV